MTKPTNTLAIPGQSTVISSDGVEIAVYETGNSNGPTALLIHGYPDDHSVWKGVTRHLSERFRVLSYDVRGSGASGRPQGTAAYRIPQLIDDLESVLESFAPHGGVHVLAHDWGSVQTWDALGDPRFGGRIASFTSISGPSLDMVALWLRGIRANPRSVAGQMLGSSYMPLFQLPVLPEMLVRAGVVDRGIAWSSSHGGNERTAVRSPEKATELAGLALYRANLARRLLAPRPIATSIPVQVLAPADDPHANVDCQTQSPAPFVENLHTRVIDGNHWVITHRPRLVASCFSDFVDFIERIGQARTPSRTDRRFLRRT